MSRILCFSQFAHSDLWLEEPFSSVEFQVPVGVLFFWTYPPRKSFVGGLSCPNRFFVFMLFFCTPLLQDQGVCNPLMFLSSSVARRIVHFSP